MSDYNQAPDKSADRIQELLSIDERLQELEKWSFKNLYSHTVHEPAHGYVGESSTTVIDPNFADAVHACMKEFIDRLRHVDAANPVKVVRYVVDGEGCVVPPSITQPHPGVAHVASKGHFREVPYHIAIDTDGSPRNIPFSVALEYLKAGRKIKRSSWRNTESKRIEARGNGAIGGIEVIVGASNYVCDFNPSCADMVACDWMVLPKD